MNSNYQGANFQDSDKELLGRRMYAEGSCKLDLCRVRVEGREVEGEVGGGILGTIEGSVVFLIGRKISGNFPFFSCLPERYCRGDLSQLPYLHFMLNSAVCESVIDSNSMITNTSVSPVKPTKTLVTQLLNEPRFSVTFGTPQELNTDELEALAIATSDAFGIEMSSADIKNHLLECDVIGCVYIDETTPIGFASLKVVDNNAYLYGIAIQSQYQKHGLTRVLCTNLFQGYDCVFFRTQNLGLIRSMKGMGRDVLLGADAVAYMESLDSETWKSCVDFSTLKNGVFKGAYGTYLGNPQKHCFIDGDVYPDFNASAGDALFVVTM